jgi:NAD(P)-dependent dehydrogenase (short-subunit alcohol dehydrogenase family)
MDLGLTGKRALVTGASKGIGRAIAEVLAAEGVSLHLASRTEADLARARDEINERHGVQVTIHAMDLADSANVRKLVADTVGIDILVNNAGAIPGGDLDAIDEARWRDAWNLKVFGYVNLTRAMFARMKRRRSGVILNVTGLGGLMPTSGYIAGSAGNASLNAFSEALGGDSLDYGVRVLAVAPGLVVTERMETVLRARAQKEWGDADRWRDRLQAMNLPGGRAAEPKECADLVCFLASPRAGYVNGITVRLDGGFMTRTPIF